MSSLSRMVLLKYYFLQIILDVSNVTSDWKRGTNRNGVRGLFPSNHVEEMRPLVSAFLSLF
jgi:hypothetical protein